MEEVISVDEVPLGEAHPEAEARSVVDLVVLPEAEVVAVSLAVSLAVPPVGEGFRGVAGSAEVVAEGERKLKIVDFLAWYRR